MKFLLSIYPISNSSTSNNRSSPIVSEINPFFSNLKAAFPKNLHLSYILHLLKNYLSRSRNKPYRKKEIELFLHFTSLQLYTHFSSISHLSDQIRYDN